MTDRYESIFVPREIRGLAALVLIAGNGTFDQLRALGFSIEDGFPSRLAVMCPGLDINVEQDSFSTEEPLPEKLEANLFEAILCAERDGERKDLNDYERCFDRFTTLATHMIELGDVRRSIDLLSLTKQIFSIENADEKRSFSGSALKLFRGVDESESVDSPTAPLLRVRLFGNLEIDLAGKPLLRSVLHRGLSKTMLCLLVLNQGKGLPRETMIDWLWPERDNEKAVSGFYNLWSRVCTALPFENGTSPYFKNDERLLRINPKLVSSDIADFEQLSRAVLFEQGTLDERLAAIDRIEQLYANDILSGSAVHPRIVAAQHRYRDILIDVLLSASSLHLQSANNAMALWYARRALDTDPSREDIYRALMHTQDACGQRTQAIGTYHECRCFLDEELGLLPSNQTTALYQSLILDGQ